MPQMIISQERKMKSYEMQKNDKKSQLWKETTNSATD